MKQRASPLLRIVMLLLIVLSLCGARSRPVNLPIRPSPLVIEINSVDLDERRPERKMFGSLQLLTAVQLQSKDRRFGGISGISFGADGALYAISDRGYWLSAQTTSDANGALERLSGWQIAPMLTPARTSVSGRLRDAEALARIKDGSFLVGFEGAHRVWRYAAPPHTLSSVPISEDIPAALLRAPSNGGIEALAELHDGRLLILTEDFRNSDGSVKGWLRGNGRWGELSYLTAEGYHVTDCAALANGDLLVLERRFAFLAILSTRVTLVAAASLKPGAKLEGRELLRLEQPLTVDNFEGIAVKESAGGSTILLISDDNYSSFQQTLLLQFLLPAKGALTTQRAP